MGLLQRGCCFAGVFVGPFEKRWHTLVPPSGWVVVRILPASIRVNVAPEILIAYDKTELDFGNIF